MDDRELEKLRNAVAFIDEGVEVNCEKDVLEFKSLFFWQLLINPGAIISYLILLLLLNDQVS